jgi:hypothetical protein
MGFFLAVAVAVAVARLLILIIKISIPRHDDPVCRVIVFLLAGERIMRMRDASGRNNHGKCRLYSSSLLSLSELAMGL